MDGAQESFVPVQIPLWVDLLAVFIAGLSGSLIAIRNRFDPAGVMVVTLVSAMGGGIIRDVLIGSGPPAALRNPDYLYTAFAAAGIGFMFRRFVGRVNRWFIPIDAAALGLYTFVGMQKGINFNLPMMTAILLGVITATGGGLLRDLLSGEVPNVLRPGHLSMTASIVGALLYAVLHWMGVSGFVAVWIIVAVVMGLRLASEYFGWVTPEASAVPQQMTAVRGTLLAAPRKIHSPVLRPPGSEGVGSRLRLRRRRPSSIEQADPAATSQDALDEDALSGESSPPDESDGQ